MSVHWLLAGLITAQALFLVLYASGLAIGAQEAAFLYGGSGWLWGLVDLSLGAFGQNNLALRLPFIVIHLINLVLLYLVAQDLVRKPMDAWIAVAIYALLPGVNSAALLINAAGVVMLVSLLFLWLLPRFRVGALTVLVLSVMLHEAFLLLLLAMSFYGIYRRDWLLSILAIAGFGVSLGVFGFDVRGRPAGFFADLFGLYGAIFSPLIFVGFVYGIYWFWIRYARPLPALWFLSSVVFVLSILLSLRQRLPLEDFAPYVVIATPLMVVAFMNSWRIRLPGFRRFHTGILAFCVGSLVLLSTLTFFNKPLYLVLQNPADHFAQSHHYPHWLAEQLMELGIHGVRTLEPDLAQQLAFYQIAAGGDFVLSIRPPSFGPYETIEYKVFSRKVQSFYLWPDEQGGV